MNVFTPEDHKRAPYFYGNETSDISQTTPERKKLMMQNRYEIDSLINEKQRLLEETIEYNRKLVDKETEIKTALRKKLDDLRNAIDTMSNEKNELQKNLEKEKKDIHSLKKHVNQLEKEKSSFLSNQEEINESIYNNQREIQAKNEKIHNIEKMMFLENKVASLLNFKIDRTIKDDTFCDISIALSKNVKFFFEDLCYRSDKSSNNSDSFYFHCSEHAMSLDVPDAIGKVLKIQTPTSYTQNQFAMLFHYICLATGRDKVAPIFEKLNEQKLNVESDVTYESELISTPKVFNMTHKDTNNKTNIPSKLKRNRKANNGKKNRK
eukprot:TRINITY_DN3083_c0_g1_i4.p1 TRINITY_DN3083_c0_g1~~TRINITY_DN3083_c0_g1_i4.p1  ORF type:complete len:322 (+),score=107.76 TRINITY_DN3083_c0_g1_i4:1628-2593(+)